MMVLLIGLGLGAALAVIGPRVVACAALRALRGGPRDPEREKSDEPEGQVTAGIMIARGDLSIAKPSTPCINTSCRPPCGKGRPASSSRRAGAG